MNFQAQQLFQAETCLHTSVTIFDSESAGVDTDFDFVDVIVVVGIVAIVDVVIIVVIAVVAVVAVVVVAAVVVVSVGSHIFAMASSNKGTSVPLMLTNVTFGKM